MRCPSCSATVDEGAWFCPACAHQLVEGVAAELVPDGAGGDTARDRTFAHEISRTVAWGDPTDEVSAEALIMGEVSSEVSAPALAVHGAVGGAAGTVGSFRLYASPIAADVADVSRIPRRIAAMVEASLTPYEVFVYEQVDGVRSIARIQAAGLLAPAEIQSSLITLIERGLIALEAPPRMILTPASLPRPPEAAPPQAAPPQAAPPQAAPPRALPGAAALADDLTPPRALEPSPSRALEPAPSRAPALAPDPAPPPAASGPKRRIIALDAAIPEAAARARPEVEPPRAAAPAPSGPSAPAARPSASPAALPPIAPGARPEIARARRLYEAAMKDSATGNVLSARMNLKLAVAFDPDTVAYQDAFARLEQVSAPKATSDPRLTLRPAAQRPFDEGCLAEAAGDIDRAVKCFETALRHGDDAMILNRLGVVLAMKKGDWRRAQVLLARAVDLAPGNEAYVHNLGKVLSTAAARDVSRASAPPPKKGGLWSKLFKR